MKDPKFNPTWDVIRIYVEGGDLVVEAVAAGRVFRQNLGVTKYINPADLAAVLPDILDRLDAAMRIAEAPRNLRLLRQ